MVKRFLASGRSGFYVAVVREGEVGAEDEMQTISRDPNAVPVSEITRLYVAKRYSGEDARILERALHVTALPESWKEYFRDRLEHANVWGRGTSSLVPTIAQWTRLQPLTAVSTAQLPACAFARHSFANRDRTIQFRRDRLKFRLRPLPVQLFYVFEEGNISPQRS